MIRVISKPFFFQSIQKQYLIHDYKSFQATYEILPVQDFDPDRHRRSLDDRSEVFLRSNNDVLDRIGVVIFHFHSEIIVFH